MSDYSLELNEDQIQITKWVHEFAENVVRPAGPEWDEREETPWPIIEEAAKVGLYSFDFITQCFFDQAGLTSPFSFTDPWDGSVHGNCVVEDLEVQVQLRDEFTGRTELNIRENRT